MARFDPFGEIGKSGLVEFHGRPEADFLREMRGIEAYKRFNEMRLNSPVVGGMLLAVETAIRKAQFRVTSDQGEDDPRLEFVRECYEAMSQTMIDHISEALTMLPFGYSLFEIVYKRDEMGRIVWRKFAVRGQDTIERWELDGEDGIQGAYQRAAPSYKEVLLPIEKCLLYRTRVERNNPEGRSILRTAWVPYYYLKNLQQIEGIGVERDLAGMPVVTLPDGASTDPNDPDSDASRAAKMARNLRRDEQEGVVLPPGWKLELLSTGGSRQFDTNAIIGRYEGRILLSILAQFLILGQNTVGTYSLSADQSDFFNMAVNYIAGIIADVQTRFAIPRLLALNGLNAEGIRYTHSPVGDVDLDMLADVLSKTSSLITWLPQDEMWWRDTVGLPEADEMQIQDERDRKAEQAIQLMQRTGGQAARDNGDNSEDNDEDDQDAQDAQDNNSAVPAKTIGDLVQQLRRLGRVDHV